ncbi:hypothetical protein MES4922_210189 [Mesorhizobium ventifaucium]|uniref:Uncharacterized protein n=1 Tax=Mesorhizobium ventifaucium TaxID=666020 RepID=A0ABM9DRG8_9HYPH|nr:hypothetical protein MES4922_210189 [Mesorhizobium ventifaucium]
MLVRPGEKRFTHRFKNIRSPDAFCVASGFRHQFDPFKTAADLATPPKQGEVE